MSYLLQTPASFYFRIKVPKDPRNVLKKPEIKASPKTTHKKRALRLAALYTIQFHNYFDLLRESSMRILAVGFALILCLYAPATAEMFKIENPASNIYNPASRMDNPNPLSPPTQSVPKPATTETTHFSAPQTPEEQVKEQQHPQIQQKPNHSVTHKSYHFKTGREYLGAVKMSFKRKDYKKAIFIIEEALGRIKSGTLKASRKTKQKLIEYRASGYTFLDKMKGKEVDGR